MERRRRQPAETSDAAARGDVILAEDILSPRLLRFGNQHQIREATWLVSEMYKRIKTKGTKKLFLQDREGRLYGALNLWTMLSALASDLKEDDLATIDAERLAEILCAQFDEPITDLCQRELPEVTPHTPLTTLVRLSRQSEMQVLAVRDQDEHITGLVSQLDLLKGIGKGLGFRPEKELPKA